MVMGRENKEARDSNQGRVLRVIVDVEQRLHHLTHSWGQSESSSVPSKPVEWKALQIAFRRPRSRAYVELGQTLSSVLFELSVHLSSYTVHSVHSSW